MRFNYGVDLPNFDVSLLYNLESINILGRCFQSVKVFKIDGLNRLKRLVIGVESFTNGTDKEMDKSKSFHVLNCKSLKLIKMGRYAFHDYAGEFELKNLPSLVSLNIGESAEIDCGAYNFYHCSFVVRGFEILKDFWAIDLPRLRSIELGYGAFHNSVSTVLESIISKYRNDWNRSSLIGICRTR